MIIPLDRQYLPSAKGQSRDGEEIVANSCNLTFVPDNPHEWEFESGGSI